MNKSAFLRLHLIMLPLWSLTYFFRAHSRTSIAWNEKPLDVVPTRDHLSKSQNIRRVRHCAVDSAGLLLSVLVYTRCRLL